MRILSLSLMVTVLIFSYGKYASAQTSTQNIFSTNLSLGSNGAQVTALQQALNQDQSTRVAETGPGSPGNETNYFGPLTKAAVVRFQEKYASEVLLPVELVKGSGYVGSYTRAKLHALSAIANSGTTGSSVTTTTASSTQTATATDPSLPYLVKDNEKIDIYVGDTMLTNIQDKIIAAVNAGVEARIASRSAEPIAIPSIAATDAPSVALGTPAPRSGVPGTYISMKGTGISTESVVYFGSNYIVRKVSKGFSNDFIFVVPPIPPGRYDIAVRTGGNVSNTTMFVVTDLKNPPVHLQSVSPTTISYGDTLTIVGSGFSKENNAVVTSYQTIINVPSADGATLIVHVAPPSLQTSAEVGDGKIKKPMSLYVVSDYGFSDSTQSFTMTL